LVAGGKGDAGLYLNSAEFYDPATGIWIMARAMAMGRFAHTATLLPNGKVLVAGGANNISLLESAEVYDPATGAWTATGPMSDARRYQHTATLLPNGKVLVAGGRTPFVDSIASTELYDSATGTWTVTGKLNTGRLIHTATLLRSGQALVEGGYSGGYLNSAELYDPDTGVWVPTLSMNEPRIYHTATLLPNGNVLAVGGENRNRALTSAELYSLNAIDQLAFFVTQHYRDFLNRQPDPAGLAFWINQITSCGSDQTCVDIKRINVSAAFFLSIEFQQTGYLVERMYKAAYGDASGSSTLGGAHQLKVPIVRFNEFLPDTQRIGQGVVVGQMGWETGLENNKQAFAAEFVQRSRFTTAFPTTLTPAQFVDNLFVNAAVTPSSTDRNAVIAEFGLATDTTDVAARGRALRRVAENSIVNTQEFNRAFVVMQYFDYLRRNPNDSPDSDYSGYDFWLTKLNQFNGNFIDAEMVKAFISSTEYRQRFGP
ncbi:MAG: hypothetical protein DMF76_22605, partial [Acidobacteria bacterium]